MRLLTHNLLCCLKCQSFPLSVTSSEIAQVDAAYDGLFVRRMLARLEYPFLRDAFNEQKAAHPSLLAAHAELPEALDDSHLVDGSPVSRAIHFAMNGFMVKNGILRCSKCETVYPIIDSIPNMVSD
jgi:uncharacterized protein YbaR (Trm112 family)